MKTRTIFIKIFLAFVKTPSAKLRMNSNLNKKDKIFHLVSIAGSASGMDCWSYERLWVCCAFSWDMLFIDSEKALDRGVSSWLDTDVMWHCLHASKATSYTSHWNQCHANIFSLLLGMCIITTRLSHRKTFPV